MVIVYELIWVIGIGKFLIVEGVNEVCVYICSVVVE